MDSECNLEKFEYHLDMMEEYGLIHIYLHNDKSESSYKIPLCMISRYDEKTRLVLTWKDQDFLGNLETNGVWKEIKGQAKHLSLTVLMTLAAETAKKMVGF